MANAPKDVLQNTKATANTATNITLVPESTISTGKNSTMKNNVGNIPPELAYHIETGRGFISAGLIEKIRALSIPPIPWDAALAKWFDVYFSPLEKHRSYARPSLRQACSHDIPHPRYSFSDISVDNRTFDVIINTSGSMDTKFLCKAIGSIASYAVAHEVPFVRVIFCNAKTYDTGYFSPKDIAGRIKVQGRVGTALLPCIDKLESALDFPKSAAKGVSASV